MANLKKLFNEKHKAQIQKDLGLKNVMQVPHLDKIVINMGLGEALQNGKLIDAGVEQLRTITGQQPVVTRAKKAISNFKLREGVPIGVRVTLRGNRMYEFFERLVGFALPRVGSSGWDPGRRSWSTARPPVTPTSSAASGAAAPPR